MVRASAAGQQRQQGAFSVPNGTGTSSGAALNFDDVLAELDDISRAGRHAEAKACQQTATDSERHGSQTPRHAEASNDAATLPSASGQAQSCQHVQLPARLPEFWIEAQHDVAAAQPHLAPRLVSELAHAQDLWQGYEASMEAGAGATDAGGGVNAAETYEAPTAYDRFQRQLHLKPEQCVRRGPRPLHLAQ